MAGIIKKELSQFFRTMSGYIFLAVFVAISGFYFLAVNIVGKSGDIKDFFSAISPVLLFLVPIITMRAYSEERRQHTDELLLTSPTGITTIILGKFFACMIMLLIATAVIWIYAIILALHGSRAPMDTFANWFGFVLLTGAYISIGLFVSVLAESQIIAAVVSYAVLLFMYVIDSSVSADTGRFAAVIMRAVSLKGHYTDFTYGILSAANVVYFLSITAFFLFLSVFALEHKRLD